MTDRLPTPSQVLNRARDIGHAAGLRHVYIGNVRQQGESTFCPSCNRLLIERDGYVVRQNRVRRGACPYCNAPVAGIWERKVRS